MSKKSNTYNDETVEKNSTPSAPPLHCYTATLEWMSTRVSAIQAGTEPECLWFLEHPPLYTLGTSGKALDILPSATLPTFQTGRGGQVTYHGPGQRIVYAMIDLRKREQDLRLYVATLEEWIIQALAHFEIKGERRPGRVGIWVEKKRKDHKIAALGVRVQKWVTSHGFALNVSPDLTAYQHIVPCGLSQYGVTSLADLGVTVTMEEVDEVLIKTCPFNT